MCKKNKYVNSWLHNYSNEMNTVFEWKPKNSTWPLLKLSPLTVLLSYLYRTKDQTTCTVPARIANREFKIRCLSGSCEKRPGRRIEQLAVIETRCADGYGIEGKTETLSTCVDGQWKPPVPRCESKFQTEWKFQFLLICTKTLELIHDKVSVWLLLGNDADLNYFTFS